MQWNASYQPSRCFSFANNINTHEGGSHLSGFRAALTRTLNAYARATGAAQGEGREPVRRGHARGARRDHLGQAARAAVRGPDEDQARQPVDHGRRRDGHEPSSSRVPRGAPERRARRSCSKVVEAARARQAARKARDLTRRKTRARQHAPARQARRLLDHRPGAVRALPGRGQLAPAARPSTRATASSRRSCRCAARSSTSRRRASTRCSRTTRSRP